jgi:hypothetical protein
MGLWLPHGGLNKLGVEVFGTVAVAIGAQRSCVILKRASIKRFNSIDVDLENFLLVTSTCVSLILTTTHLEDKSAPSRHLWSQIGRIQFLRHICRETLKYEILRDGKPTLNSLNLVPAASCGHKKVA